MLNQTEYDRTDNASAEQTQFQGRNNACDYQTIETRGHQLNLKFEKKDIQDLHVKSSVYVHNFLQYKHLQKGERIFSTSQPGKAKSIPPQWANLQRGQGRVIEQIHNMKW